MQNETAIARLTADLLQARDEVRVTTMPSQFADGIVLELGYQVGRTLHGRLMERGYRPVGRKIGFTNPAMWERFKVTQPIWAHVYEQTVHFAEDGQFRLSLDCMVAPRLEPEIVLKLRAPMPNGDASAEEIAGCLEWAAIGFEIVDSHFPGWRFTAAEAVADFGVHAGLVIGPAWRVHNEDPRRVAMSLRTLKVGLKGGKDFAADGEGSNVLGSPLLALGFLARVLVGQSWAAPLAAGEVITTGTLTALPILQRGESYRVEVAGAPLRALRLDLD
jgi:2-oxo-3-hexenedioate decarboxylase